MPEAIDQQASALPTSDLQVQTGPANRPQEPEDYNCPICLDLLLEPVVGACGHEFCKDCYTRWLARSRGSPSCPLCRKVLAFTVPGVSRRLADLIEATFPEKIELRRQTREREAAAEAPLQGQSGQFRFLGSDDGPPGLAAAAESLLGRLPMMPNDAVAPNNVFRGPHWRRLSNRRPDSPYPGLGAYPGAADVFHSYELSTAFDSPGFVTPGSPASSSDPSTAGDEEEESDGSPPYSYPGSPRSPGYYNGPSYSPTSPVHYGYSSASPRQSPTSPVHSPRTTYSPLAHSLRSPTYSPASPEYIRQDDHSYSSHGDRSLLANNRHDAPSFASFQGTDSGYTRRHSGLGTGSTYAPTSPAYLPLSPSPPHHASVSPLNSPGGAATMAGGSPSRQPSGTTEAAARPTAPAAAGTGSGHDGPQPHAALLQPNTDFSRLLQSSDQLAQQLQSASARLSYLTEYADHFFARHTAPPTQYPPCPSCGIAHPSGAEHFYPGHIGMSVPPWPAYGSYGTSGHYAPAPASYRSVPFSLMPWPGAFGPHNAPAPLHAAPSFAQSMPPPGTLPFTIGSEPREVLRSSQAAATAMNPARYRSRVPQRRSRDRMARAVH